MVDALAGLEGFRGTSLAAYAKDHGLALRAMYYWRRGLMREGRWQQEPKPKASAKSRSHSARTAPYEVSATERCSSMLVTMRLHLANGRRAEIDLMGIDWVEAILGTLGRQP